MKVKEVGEKEGCEVASEKTSSRGDRVKSYSIKSSRDSKTPRVIVRSKL
jgi:hypothetical protein